MILTKDELIAIIKELPEDTVTELKTAYSKYPRTPAFHSDYSLLVILTENSPKTD